MADPKKPSAESPPSTEELDDERDDEEQEADEEREDEDEDEDEDDDDDDDEDGDDEDDDARATSRSDRPGASTAPDDWLPDWAPWGVLGTILVIGLGGGLFYSTGFNLQPAPEPVASAATTATTPTAARSARRHPTAAANPRDRGESISASHVLISYKGAMRSKPDVTRTKEEAKQRAREVLKKAKAGGDFGELAAEYSDEPNAARRKGNLGSFTRQRMVKPFADAAFKLKPGEISDVVETPFGFHVIKRTK